jgi:hypothetical protein
VFLVAPSKFEQLTSAQDRMFAQRADKAMIRLEQAIANRDKKRAQKKIVESQKNLDELLDSPPIPGYPDLGYHRESNLLFKVIIVDKNTIDVCLLGDRRGDGVDVGPFTHRQLAWIKMKGLTSYLPETYRI